MTNYSRPFLRLRIVKPKLDLIDVLVIFIYDWVRFRVLGVYCRLFQLYYAGPFYWWRKQNYLAPLWLGYKHWCHGELIQMLNSIVQILLFHFTFFLFIDVSLVIEIIFFSFYIQWKFLNSLMNRILNFVFDCWEI